MFHSLPPYLFLCHLDVHSRIDGIHRFFVVVHLVYIIYQHIAVCRCQRNCFRLRIPADTCVYRLSKLHRRSTIPAKKEAPHVTVSLAALSVRRQAPVSCAEPPVFRSVHNKWCSNQNNCCCFYGISRIKKLQSVFSCEKINCSPYSLRLQQLRFSGTAV